MADLVEWHVPERLGSDYRRIILHFDGKEYLLGSAEKVSLRSGRFYWEFSWRNKLFNFADGGYFALETGAPLEPYQEKMNGYIAVNLWRIVRRLKEIEDEKHS